MYRILTEDKQVEEVKAILIDLALDFTLTHAIGVWHGVEEKSLVIDFEDADKYQVIRAAQRIKYHNSQEAVLVQYIQSIPTFV